MTYRILLVEDDRGIAEAIASQLSLWGLEARCVQNFRDVTGEFAAFDPHLVLLDISLPFFNGYHWCAELRKITKTPILFLSSAAENMNIVMAMNLGADDFIAKPFDFSVLIAKIQAILRRCYDYAPAPLLSCRGATLNLGEQSLTLGDEHIPLTKNECRILQTLLENKGKTVSREKLMGALWQNDSYIDENALSVNVGRLRKKLNASHLEGVIQTKFGVGYLVEAEEC